MPRGNFTERWIKVNCGYCTKQIEITQGQYDRRISRSKTGKLFCSPQCLNDSRSKNDVRDQKLICKRCDKDFTHSLHKHIYNRRIKSILSGEDVFCSKTCAITYTNQRPDKIKIISEKQKGIAAPQRGRMGHVTSPATRMKISQSRLDFNETGSSIITLQCVRCNKTFDRPKWYHNSLMEDNKGRGPFCSRLCAAIGHEVSEETKQKISSTQIGMTKQNRGVVGHPVSNETRIKIRMSRAGFATKVDWDVVVSELSRRGISKYAIMREPIPDAVWIEGDKLVALELEKKRWEADVRRKMRQYESVNKFDKVILVWYTRELKRMKEWTLEHGVWTLNLG